ncbi:MAG: hypothetical protein WCX27_01475 [Candidatus Paceibacterota bacterium]|jgi:hypothetical protein
MSWSQRRKATYTLSFLSLVAITLIVVFFSFFNKKATCFDGVKNQDELGVDCGGSCTILCRAEYTNPKVLWERWAKISSSGTYNMLAYVQNPNIGAAVMNAPYTFKIYDRNNVLLLTKSGMTYIPASTNFAVFEDGISIGDKVPARIVFQFADNLVWQKTESKELSITAISKTLVNEDSQPKIFVTLKNNTLLPVRNIESIAIAYDENDNALGFSKTKTDLIEKEGTAEIVFTWPERFEKKVLKIEIVSKVLPE